MIAFFMRSIDGWCILLLHEVMSRPFRFLLPAVIVASTLGFSGCGTIYDNMYSYHKTHFKPPKEEETHAKEPSAEALLGEIDKNKPAGQDGAVQPGLPPAGDIPGLPPTTPAPDGAAPAPGAPPAPAAPPQ